MPIASAIEAAADRVIDGLIADTVESQRKKGLYASGKSAKSLRRIAQRSGTIISRQIVGAAHWKYQQNGRGPSRSGRGGGRSLVDALREWKKHKGIEINEYALAKKIHREGIRVPNRFNPGGVLSEPLNAKRVTGLLKTAVRSELIQSIRSELFS